LSSASYQQRDQPDGVPPLALTGERTLPDVPEENYWYRRHLVVYEWIAAQVAGQRVEIIKPDVKRGGMLELGTELVAAADRSLVALLGASPGASTAAFIAISVLEKCFPNELTATGWLPKLKEIIPSYGVSLIEDADLLRRVRADTAAVLKVENV